MLDLTGVVHVEWDHFPPEVILAAGDSTLPPLLELTRTVPIVFPVVVDPVGAGYVESLARPGGNVTGFMNFEYGASGKWLELLKEVAPTLTRVAVLRDPANPYQIAQFGAMQAVGPSLRLGGLSIASSAPDCRLRCWRPP
jgi:putative tryptophan/tyrosine transport system substrate-binding protein